MATLDILIPHFRDAEGFERSLNSVITQSWTGDYRLVVVDDASPAADVARVEALLARVDTPSLLLRNERNRGRPFTRNRLLDHVDGDFVAWLDAGDTWHPEKLALQFSRVNQLRRESFSAHECWITCNYEWLWENGRRRQCVQEVDNDHLRELFMGTNLRAYLWTILAPSSTFRQVGWFDERLPRLQDLDYFIRFVIAGGEIRKPLTKRFLARYYKSDFGRDSKTIYQCNKMIFKKYEAFLMRYGKNFVRMREFNAALLGMRVARNNGQIGRSFAFFARTFWTHPMLATWRLASGGYAP